VRAMFPGRLFHLGGRDINVFCLGEAGLLALPVVLTRSMTAKAAGWGNPNAHAAATAVSNRRSKRPRAGGGGAAAVVLLLPGVRLVPYWPSQSVF
jgi:hypothetical protein